MTRRRRHAVCETEAVSAVTSVAHNNSAAAADTLVAIEIEIPDIRSLAALILQSAKGLSNILAENKWNLSIYKMSTENNVSEATESLSLSRKCLCHGEIQLHKSRVTEIINGRKVIELSEKAAAISEDLDAKFKKKKNWD